MARDIRDVWAYRDRMRTRQDEQRPGMFRGTNYVTGAQLDAEDEQRRELEMQRLKNTGQLDVTELQQTGATTRTGMTEGGATQRLGMTEAGRNQRFGTEQANRFKYLAQQQAGDRKLEELRGMNKLGLLDARGKQELDLMEKEYGLRSQEPLYKEFTTTDPLGGTTSYWQDVKALDRDLATIEELGSGTFTNAPTATDFDNQTVGEYERSTAQALGPRRDYGADNYRNAVSNDRITTLQAAGTSREDQSAFQDLVSSTPGRTAALNQSLTQSRQNPEIPIVRGLRNLAANADPEAPERRRKQMIQSFGGGRTPYDF